ncbi:hypothetical protein HDU76_001992 [Blyttiomyces sp. JEL0837]|nr:hypothetical protein HDU76_001992 [Blyttiomyces sp. JEL0837]
MRLLNIATNEIQHFDNPSDAPVYAAISYVWPQTQPGHSFTPQIHHKWKEALLITVDGSYKPLSSKWHIPSCSPQDLNAALASIYRDGAKVHDEFDVDPSIPSDRPQFTHLWMDVLCVNQEDDLDKANDIKNMKDYYANATCVWVFLNNLGFCDVPITEKGLARWFKRLWCLQECILPSKLYFFLRGFEPEIKDDMKTKVLSQIQNHNQPNSIGEGTAGSSTDNNTASPTTTTQKFTKAFSHFYKKDDHNKTNSSWSKEPGHRVKGIWISRKHLAAYIACITDPSLHDVYSPTEMEAFETGLQLLPLGIKNPTIETALLLSSVRECRFRSDRFYGIMGILPENPDLFDPARFKIDYRMSYEEVSQLFSRALGEEVIRSFGLFSPAPSDLRKNTTGGATAGTTATATATTKPTAGDDHVKQETKPSNLSWFGNFETGFFKNGGIRYTPNREDLQGFLTNPNYSLKMVREVYKESGLVEPKRPFNVNELPKLSIDEKGVFVNGSHIMLVDSIRDKGPNSVYTRKIVKESKVLKSLEKGFTSLSVSSSLSVPSTTPSTLSTPQQTNNTTPPMSPRSVLDSMKSAFKLDLHPSRSESPQPTQQIDSTTTENNNNITPPTSPTSSTQDQSSSPTTLLDTITETTNGRRFLGNLASCIWVLTDSKPTHIQWGYNERNKYLSYNGIQRNWLSKANQLSYVEKLKLLEVVGSGASMAPFAYPPFARDLEIVTGNGLKLYGQGNQIDEFENLVDEHGNTVQVKRPLVLVLISQSVTTAGDEGKDFVTDDYIVCTVESTEERVRRGGEVSTNGVLNVTKVGLFHCYKYVEPEVALSQFYM